MAKSAINFTWLAKGRILHSSFLPQTVCIRVALMYAKVKGDLSAKWSTSLLGTSLCVDEVLDFQN